MYKLCLRINHKFIRLLSTEIPKGLPPHRMAEAEEEALSESYKHPENSVSNTKTDMQELLDSGESADYKKY